MEGFMIGQSIRECEREAARHMSALIPKAVAAALAVVGNRVDRSRLVTSLQSALIAVLDSGPDVVLSDAQVYNIARECAERLDAAEAKV